MSVRMHQSAQSAAGGEGLSTSEGTERTDSPMSSIDRVLLVTAGFDHTIKLWNVATTDCVHTFTHNDSVHTSLSTLPFTLTFTQTATLSLLPLAEFSFFTLFILQIQVFCSVALFSQIGTFGYIAFAFVLFYLIM